MIEIIAPALVGAVVGALIPLFLIKRSRSAGQAPAGRTDRLDFEFANFDRSAFNSSLIDFRKTVAELRAVVDDIVKLQHQPQSSQVLQSHSAQPSSTQTPSQSARTESQVVSDQIVSAFKAGAETLRSRYTIKIFGVFNLVELKDVPTATPIYGENSEGDFWLISISGAAFGVPVPGRVFTADQYKLGGMGDLFDCLGYKPGYRFQQVNLIKPARLQLDGQNWIKAEKGQISLEDGTLDQ